LRLRNLYGGFMVLAHFTHLFFSFIIHDEHTCLLQYPHERVPNLDPQT
jgi:hypothetical protein